MAIIGVALDKKNPEFKLNDFLFWMPQFYKVFIIVDENGDPVIENDQPKPRGDMLPYFEKLEKIADSKIFESIFGTDWEYAMSLCIAHYLWIIGKRLQTPSGSELADVAGGGAVTGILTSANIGQFSKSYDLDKSLTTSDDAKWWNQSKYGAELMNLLKTKAVPSVFVTTSGPITKPYENDHFDPLSPFNRFKK